MAQCHGSLKLYNTVAAGACDNLQLCMNPQAPIRVAWSVLTVVIDKFKDIDMGMKTAALAQPFTNRTLV